MLVNILLLSSIYLTWAIGAFFLPSLEHGVLIQYISFTIMLIYFNISIIKANKKDSAKNEETINKTKGSAKKHSS